jgi:hypothetical protein
MSNTTISLSNRIVNLRNHFQSVGVDTWNTWSTGDRAGFILGSLDTESSAYNDGSIYDIFFRAYHSSKHSPIHLADLDFSQMMEILDLAERYAKNWIFS